MRARDSDSDYWAAEGIALLEAVCAKELKAFAYMTVDSLWVQLNQLVLIHHMYGSIII